ncbi:MAG TPA: ATPase, T2SS/T4P/T4SS family [Vicinamibacterales bacterium]|nr:ATPase, T2SS/T4P/T4SS family [Vicinamibacterales bacterium]
MTLVPSLLQAIIRIDGEALVMHPGDKPYVVSPTGQIELANKGLTLEAVDSIVGQLLSAESLSALDEFGAVQYELPAYLEFPGEQFTIVAARGGDDLWVEIRRRRMAEEDQVPAELFSASTTPRAQEPSQRSSEDDRVPDEFLGSGGVADAAYPAPAAAARDETLSLPDAAALWPAGTQVAGGAADSAPLDDLRLEEGASPTAVGSTPPFTTPFVEPTVIMPPSQPVPTAAVSPEERAEAPVAPAPPPAPAQPSASAQPSAAAPPPAPEPAAAVENPWPEPAASAVVLPMSRNPIRSEYTPPSVTDPTMAGLERLLRLAAARGASTLYLSTDSRPSVRVDGELQALEGEGELTSRDVESLLLTLMPERSHEALRTGAATEWICEIEDVGRVRCMSFRDHSGPGGVFRLMPARSVSVEQLGLPKQVTALAIEPEGLVLVVGPRSSGKRTLMAALVDQINRTRRDHVITVEREISIVHQRGSSFISQREIRGNDEDLLTAARAALREDPDVLVVEDLRTGPLMNVALEAAASGHLVVGGFSAHTSTAAIDRIIDLYAPEYRRQVQLALADNLKGVIVQVLLRKVGGGRTAARELLLNTGGVSGVIAEGKTSQLPMAIEGGRRHGMMPLSDALVALVHNGVVDAKEAYRHASDRGGLLAAFKRQGIDTSFAEKLA